MATLNLSTNGASINRSYTSIVDAAAPIGPAASSATYGQWAVFSVAAPLVSAFQGDAGKESTLKVQSTGEGELVDLVDEFSDGRIQFAFVKVKDPNTGLPKFALIGWCGEGVPERTKGYFANHQAAVAKVLHGYHVQISARSDRDLTPEGIVKKISDASGAKYSAGSQSAAPAAIAPPVAKKPVFTPTSTNAGGSAFNPLASRRKAPTSSGPVDDDGWGTDAPPVTRTQLEKVESAYKPTRVNMRELASQTQTPSSFAPSQPSERPDVVKSSYQPVGKVDIAAIRRQAAASGNADDDRPAPVKGSYEPVGKVDIAAIRARVQQPQDATPAVSSPQPETSTASTTSSRSFPEPTPKPLGGARLAEMPKPKVANQFGSSTRSFGGTKAPTPGTFGLHSAAPTPSGGLGSAGRSFTESAGKSPAQLWAEKKAAQGGNVAPAPPPNTQPITAQTSGGWKSGYEGKKWAPVQLSKTGTSATSAEQDESRTEDDQAVTNISSIREQFSHPPVPEPPALNTSNKPMPEAARSNEGSAPVLPPPPPQPRSPTPPAEEDEGSPVRIAMPVARGPEISVQDAHGEQTEPPPPMPMTSLAKQAVQEASVSDEPESGPDPAREVAEAMVATFGHEATPASQTGASATGRRAVAEFDYVKAEENELELHEGENITNIEMVDEDWWQGQNSQGETGLFPSNYVRLVDDDDAQGGAISQAHEIPAVHKPVEEAAQPSATGHDSSGHTATALYDYEAAEENELSFVEGAIITNIDFPDEEWWSGEFNGVQGLFPANYVQLDQ